MKYFIDTEFIEGFHKPLFGKRRHFIDLISIGIVAEDGREYYAVSNEFNPNDASQWVKDNVISKLPDRSVGHHDIKANSQIAKEIIEFINPPVGILGYVGWIEKHNPIADGSDKHGYAQPEFYAYYADYDWVLFCSLFGTMMDLPKGFPMYCNDLKQTLDEYVTKLNPVSFTLTSDGSKKRNMSFDDKLDIIKRASSFPKQNNEHNALDDARWNKNLYEFLQNK